MKTFLGILAVIGILAVRLAIIMVIACLVAAWLCDIDSNKTYSWYSGIWHGLFCVPNWIRSFFNGDVLCKANDYTSAYNFWWWVTFISSLLGILGSGKKNY
ncbi:hypothetical protein AGMMS50239_09920 [Bacteroidia bacterium]|nr:hypothetical protein AGMMS50239_09920 [Bacteroidia bacterium]